MASFSDLECVFVFHLLSLSLAFVFTPLHLRPSVSTVSPSYCIVRFVCPSTNREVVKSVSFRSSKLCIGTDIYQHGSSSPQSGYTITRV